MAVWVFAALLWLVLATEARADDATVSSDGAAATADDPQLGGMPPVGDTAETPAEEPAGDPALPVESPAPETPAPAPEPPPPPAPDPVGQPPAAPSPPAPPSPAPESPVVTPPVATPPPEVPTAEPTLPAAGPIPVEPSPATGSSGESIFTIPNGSSPPPPLELPYLSDAGGGLAAVTWAGDRHDRQSGSRSETRHEGPPAAGSAGNAPLPPPPPFKDQAPSRLFVSTGGLSGGSSGGFSVGMLAALIALLAVAVQLLCSLVSLRLAPPRGNAFALRLIRPG
ncbi:MAG: hypothetical protein ACRDPP_02440 [Gaiellaceae bacterium]